MERPEKFVTVYTWFFDTYNFDYNLKDVAARLPIGASLEDVRASHYESEGRISFSVARRVENKNYDSDMKRYEEYRTKRIEALESELASLKEDE